MLDKVVIANRGEIALRILRACKELDIRTVALHSEIDRNLMHVKLADESVCIGPAPSAQSYLNIPAIISAMEITDAVAVHPGYGFLAENELARRLMQQAAAEVAQVAAAQNIQLPFANAAAQALTVAQATAANHSSMRQDLANGRPTEIGAICGAVVDFGRRLGVATPVNAVLQTAVQQAEQGIWPEAPTPEAILQLLNETIERKGNE